MTLYQTPYFQQKKSASGGRYSHLRRLRRRGRRDSSCPAGAAGSMVRNCPLAALIGRNQARCPCGPGFLNPPFQPCVPIAGTRLTDGLRGVRALRRGRPSPLTLHGSSLRGATGEWTCLVPFGRCLAPTHSLSWRSRAFSEGSLDPTVMPPHCPP